MPAKGEEMQRWVEFSLGWGYIGKNSFGRLYDRYERIFAMPAGMERKSASFRKAR
jgi:hypothetical protein